MDYLHPVSTGSEYTTYGRHGTWVISLKPYDKYVRARLMCPDGVVRIASRLGKHRDRNGQLRCYMVVQYGVSDKKRNKRSLSGVIDVNDETFYFYPKGKNAKFFEQKGQALSSD